MVVFRSSCGISSVGRANFLLGRADFIVLLNLLFILLILMNILLVLPGQAVSPSLFIFLLVWAHCSMK
jgi:hypothetical protein